MNDITVTTNEAPAASLPVGAKSPDVLMTRDPRTGGKGVVKMLVPAGQVKDFKAAGWSEA